jgi:hypothetical protein
MRSLIPPDMRIPQPSDYITFDKVFPSDFIADLMRFHPLFKGHRGKLEYGLRHAHGIFVSQNMGRDSFVGIASKEDAIRLRNTLQTAIDEIYAPRMWPRLMAANVAAFPAADGEGCDPEKDVLTMLRPLHDLLTIAEAGVKVNGKTIRQRRERRTDLKGAALMLHHTWERCGGKPTIWSGGYGESKALKFIMECLWRLDEDAKESSIRDFLTAEP